MYHFSSSIKKIKNNVQIASYFEICNCNINRFHVSTRKYNISSLYIYIGKKIYFKEKYVFSIYFWYEQ